MMIIDKILLAPYWLTLKIRHLLYDKGYRKQSRSLIPTICIGNITVGGTGKTPHTEMLLRLLSNDPRWSGKQLAVLSRGYKRESKGFRFVTTNGSAKALGDEPLQIKKKFPKMTVAVDRDRVEGCRILSEPQADHNGYIYNAASLILLDDAFQYRKLKADVNILLVDYNRPIFRDHLLPLGRLRDLPERMDKADIIIVTKCPSFLDDWEKSKWMTALGRRTNVFFTTIRYEEPAAVFTEGDLRYVHAPRAIVFSGIANDSPMLRQLSSSYQIVKHIRFGDHHKFTQKDIARIEKAVKEFPTAIVVTTEKDSQRIEDCSELISPSLRERLFQLPIRADFLSETDASRFVMTLNSMIGQ